MKKLSVIVPCYNVGQYIDRCVESLTSQTLDKSQYEIILVDDASTDDTWKHIEDWENRFPNIIITVHCDVNGKMGRARNIGLTYASGEYIGYADSDGPSLRCLKRCLRQQRMARWMLLCAKA